MILGMIWFEVEFGQVVSRGAKPVLDLEFDPIFYFFVYNFFVCGFFEMFFGL
jgi:hypothetical protein